VASSSEQEHDSSDQPNVVPDQIHLVLTPSEIATIVTALRVIELHGFRRPPGRNVAPDRPAPRKLKA